MPFKPRVLFALCLQIVVTFAVMYLSFHSVNVNLDWLALMAVAGCSRGLGGALGDALARSVLGWA